MRKKSIKTLYILPLMVLMSLWGTSSSYAQCIGIGPKVGLNIAKMPGYETPMKFKGGFSLGGVIHYPLSPSFAIWGELEYVGKGTNFKTGDEKGRRLGYLELPVFLRYYLGQGEVFKPFVFGGPTGSLLLGAGSRMTDGSKQSLKGEFKALDLNFAAGIGTIANLNYNRNLHIDLRYNYGITNVEKADEKARNHYLSVNVALTFGCFSKDPKCPTFWETDKNKMFDENGNLMDMSLNGAKVKYDKNGRIKKKNAKQPRKNRGRKIIVQ